MTHFVNASCISCKDMACVNVCPVDCFYDIGKMLVIDPTSCIDCGVCVPECPVDAIKDSPDFKWDIFNANSYETGTQCIDN